MNISVPGNTTQMREWMDRLEGHKTAEGYVYLFIYELCVL